MTRATKRVEVLTEVAGGTTAIVLLFAVGIMLLPFLLVFQWGMSHDLLVPLLAVAWLLQLGGFALLYFGRPAMVSRSGVILTGLFVLAQVLTLVNGTVLGLDIHIRDVVNVPARATSLIVYVGLLSMSRFSRRGLRVFSYGFLAFSVVACVYNLAHGWEAIGAFGTTQSSYSLQFRSFFPNRNQFGAVLFLSLVTHVYIVVMARRVRTWNVAILALQLVSLVLTLSRGALLASIVFGGILVMPALVRTAFRVLVTLSLVVFGAVVAVGAREQISNWLTYVFRPEVGATGRTEIWEVGIGVWENHSVLLGTGYYTGLDIAAADGFEYGQFHSLYIDALVDGGVVGLSLLMATLIFVARRVYTSRIEGGLKRVWIASFVAVLLLGTVESVAFFSIGFVDTLFTTFFVGLPLLLSNLAPQRGGSVRDW